MIEAALRSLCYPIQQMTLPRAEPSIHRRRSFRLRTLVPTGQEARAFTADELFQFGIEEEYFLSDARTLQTWSVLPRAPPVGRNGAGRGSPSRRDRWTLCRGARPAAALKGAARHFKTA